MTYSVPDYDFIITSNDKSAHITFVVEEYLSYQFPSLSCRIEVVDGKFAGYKANVWFSLIDVHSFIDSLELLEKTRIGKASLSALTYEDFNIVFESFNKKGDIVCLYSISKSKFDSEISILNILNGGFQINSEYLSKILINFKKLISIYELNSDKKNY